jgi:hypothetical protein
VKVLSIPTVDGWGAAPTGGLVKSFDPSGDDAGSRGAVCRLA